MMYSYFIYTRAASVYGVGQSWDDRTENGRCEIPDIVLRDATAGFVDGLDWTLMDFDMLGKF